jgi:hypothetical protein
MEKLVDDTQALKAEAQRLLDAFVARAALETNVLANFAMQGDLKRVRDRLLKRMHAAEGYPNPGFNGLAEAVARCLVLYDRKPDVYAQLVAGICVDEELFLETCEGLSRFECMVAALSDDHGYTYNNELRTIEAHSGVYPSATLEALNPSRFLQVVKSLEN